MLLTISTTHRPASDLGFLLHKHPERCQSFDLSFGKAHVFYPEVQPERCSACLLLDVDPVAMVRGKSASSGFLLAQYVNDRPYAASSFMSVAIAQVFGSALQGRCKDRPELTSTPLPLAARIDVLPVRGNGWRLVLGGWLGGADQEHPGVEVADYCRRLSKEFGDAHAFTTQGRMDWYSWCLARGGVVYRQYFWADSPLVDEGEPTSVEARLREEASGRPRGWYPSEGLVMAIAGECSIDPSRLELMRSAGPGYLAVTAWGRKHGVPSRSLDDDGGGLTRRCA
jgi:hypothetical protein